MASDQTFLPNPRTETRPGKHETTPPLRPVCADCDYQCETVKEMHQHLASTEHAPKYHCDICDTTYFSRKKLRRHDREKHPTDDGKRQTSASLEHSACASCEMLFTSKKGLSQHIASTEHTAKYSCRQCSKLYLSKSTLSKHIQKTHKFFHGKNKGKHRGDWCSGCKQWFKDQHAFEAHLRSSKHAAKYRCDLCSLVFVRLDALKEHIVGKRHQRQLRPQEQSVPPTQPETYTRPDTENPCCAGCHKAFLSLPESESRVELSEHDSKYRCGPCREIFLLEEAFVGVQITDHEGDYARTSDGTSEEEEELE
ncbi:hypothetical protein RUND412_002190 [Rhizina undulata]